MFEHHLQVLCESNRPQAVACLGENDVVYDHITHYLQQHLNFSQSHPDVIVLEAESPHPNVKVDQVRLLLERLSIRPFYGMYYVVVPHAGDMSAACYNALLKTLEEPKRAWIFLIYHHVDRIPATVKSRVLQLQCHEDVVEERVAQLQSDLLDLSSGSSVLALADQWLERVDGTLSWLSILWRAQACILKDMCLQQNNIADIRTNEKFNECLMAFMALNNKQSSITLKRCIDQTLLMWVLR